VTPNGGILTQFQQSAQSGASSTAGQQSGNNSAIAGQQQGASRASAGRQQEQGNGRALVPLDKKNHICDAKERLEESEKHEEGRVGRQAVHLSQKSFERPPALPGR
jgi:hypothetical protein